MSYGLGSLLSDCIRKYSIKEITEGKGLSRTVTWVYLSEDIENINFIKSNELIITTGFFTVGSTSLYDFISALIDRGMSGIIINTGKYIMESDITEDIIKLCSKNDFPLYIMPWEIHITDVMQELCGHILKNSQSQSAVSDAFRNLILDSEKGEKYIYVLNEEGFYNDSQYHVINISEVYPYGKIHNILNPLNENFHIMEYKGSTLIIITDTDNIMKIANLITEKEELKECKTGISTGEKGLKNIAKLYRQSADALRAAKLLEEKIAFYDNMGILSLIFAVEDKEVLKSFYIKRLKVFEEYDKIHNSNLIDTLYYYLKTGGSLSETAELMFTHRNTVGYRMNKIREISGNKFSIPEVRYEYLTAIYIRKAFLTEN